MDKKYRREIFGTIGVKVRSLSRSKFRKFDPWLNHKRTEPKFWSHNGQKDQFVIFGHGAPKMDKKSRREIFGTIGVNVRSLSRSKFRKFDPWLNHKRTEPRFWSHAGLKHHLVGRWSKRPILNFRPWDAQNG